MSKDTKKIDPFKDITEIGSPIGVSVVNGPAMPSQADIDRAAAVAPQIEPEEMLYRSPPKPTAPPQAHPSRNVAHGQRPIAEIVDEFLATIQNHPDGRLLNTTLGGRPTVQQEFKDTPRTNQHVAELRICWRDPQFQVEKAIADEKEGKPWWFDTIVPKRNQSEDSKPQLVTPEVPQSLENVVNRRREMREAVPSP